MAYRFLTLVAAVATTALIGCGSDRPATAPVMGKVTMDGQPVTTGKIFFWPESGPNATGQINADGTYTLQTFEKGDGAVLGSHAVTIKAVNVVIQENTPTSFEEEVHGTGQSDFVHVPLSNSQWLVPPHYERRETSPLKAEVKPGRNSLDFELTSQS